MAVKISSLSSGSLQGIRGDSSVERADKAFSAQSLHKTHAGSDDSINLTSNASQLRELENRIAQMSVVDAQLVEEVQRKLATGSFRVDPESSSSKLLMMELSLP